VKEAGKKRGLLWLFIFLGAILGSVLGDAIGNNLDFLSLLKDSYSVGMPKPLVLNLKVLAVTFGVDFKINIMTIVGIIMAIILYRRY
jgi:ADP-ribosylglycohydrolase